MSVILSAVLLSTATLTNVAQVAEAMREGRVDVPFDVSGTITFAREESGNASEFGVQDDTAAQIFNDWIKYSTTNVPPPGTVVRLVGKLTGGDIFPLPDANVHRIVVLGSVPPPQPILADPAQIDTGIYDSRFIRLTGVIRDAHVDDIDPRAHFICLDCKTATLPLFLFSETNRTDELRRLVGQTITVDGLCHRPTSTKRGLTGHQIRLHGFGSLQPVPSATEPFSVPDISTISRLTPRAVSSFGRCKATGIVLAAWQKIHFLLQMPDGRLSTVTLASAPTPPAGTVVDVSGFADTDLYSINLDSAIWRPSAERIIRANASDGPIVSADRIFDTADDGRVIVNPDVHGMTFRLRGTVKVMSAARTHAFTLESGGTLITVDASAVPQALEGLAEDCMIDLTAVCIVEADNWQPHRVIPLIRGVSLVLTCPSDLVVVAHPPWWTRTRLLVVLGLLLVVVFGIAVWNLILNRLVERRGRQLFRAQVEKSRAMLRVKERSNLATELHDSISQNLTAIACELTAVRRNGKADPVAAVAKLPALERMLQSCRTGLRQCLFDLRSDMFDEPDFAKVLRHAIQQLGSAAACVQIRFALSRTQLHDTTAHALVCMIRELVANALNHGHATSVKVAGAVDRGNLLVSVTDNGCGFDSACRPGPETGHFGITGIEGRVSSLRGTLSLESQAGKGTRAVITIPLPRKGKDEEAQDPPR